MEQPTPEPSMTKPSLATRRKELVERCAEQRTSLAYELKALQPAAVRDSVLAEHPVAGYVVANKKLVLGVLGAGAVAALLGRKRLGGLAGIAGTVLRSWGTIRGVLGMLGQARH
jgi:hypothetical protein